MKKLLTAVQFLIKLAFTLCCKSNQKVVTQETEQRELKQFTNMVTEIDSTLSKSNNKLITNEAKKGQKLRTVGLNSKFSGSNKKEVYSTNSA